MTTGGEAALSAEEFPAFYRAVHGHDPFPWQADLVTRVLADNAGRT